MVVVTVMVRWQHHHTVLGGYVGCGYSYGQMAAPPYCARRICWVGVTVMVRWQRHHTVLGGYVGLGLQLWSDGGTTILC